MGSFHTSYCRNCFYVQFVVCLLWGYLMSKTNAFHVTPNFKLIQHRSYTQTTKNLMTTTGRIYRGQVFARGTGSTEKYSWIEDEFEVEVRIEIPPEVSGKDIEFEIHRESVNLKIKGETEDLLAGKLRGIVALDGSFWTMEEEQDKKVLYLRLDKGESDDDVENTWKGVLEGEDQLKVDYSDEEFDVNNYVQSMGGIQEELVDKNMYTVDKMDESIAEKMKDPEKMKQMFEKWDEPNDLASGIDDGGKPAS